ARSPDERSPGGRSDGTAGKPAQLIDSTSPVRENDSPPLAHVSVPLAINRPVKAVSVKVKCSGWTPVGSAPLTKTSARVVSVKSAVIVIVPSEVPNSTAGEAMGTVVPRVLLSGPTGTSPLTGSKKLKPGKFWAVKLPVTEVPASSAAEVAVV